MLLNNDKAPGAQDSKLTLMINVTITGLPDDCTYVGTLDVNKDLSISDLKDMALTLPYFQGRDLPSECIRLREKLNNMYFGKIYRDSDTRSFKQIGIKNNQHLVV